MSWLNFESETEATHPKMKGRKTAIWTVYGNGASLGEVSWFGRWRTYAFFPKDRCVFEKDCLREIAEFCEEMTKAWREMKKAESK